MDGPLIPVLLVMALFVAARLSWCHYLKPKLWMWWHVRRYRRLWQAGLHAFEAQDYATARDRFQELLNYQTADPMEAPQSMLGLSLQLDGPRACELASKACTLGNNSSWPPIAILAGAQAQCGDFVTAVVTYQQAMSLMTDAEREIRLSSLEQLQRGEPFRANPEFDRSRVFNVKQ